MHKRVRVGIVTKACETCGSAVTRQNSDFRAHVFCSRTCYVKSAYHADTVSNANKKRVPVSAVLDVTCEQCSRKFKRPRSQSRNLNFCSRDCRQAHRVQHSVRQINPQGYAVVFVGRDTPGATKSGHMLEHRKIMQDFLGRPLVASENVHHVNGVRDDNRLENLELWSSSQPSGQRVEQKLSWAREFLELYSGTPLT